MEKYKKTAIILAGGEGSRMGYVDKAFLMYEGKPFIQHLLEKLVNYEEILIVSNNPGKYKGMPVKVIEDKVKEIGPLGGIYTGLIHSTYNESFIVSCDTPFQDVNFIDYMGRLSEKYEIALPIHKDGREPLASIYKKSIVKKIQKVIENNNYKIGLLYNECKVKKINVEEFEQGEEIKWGFRNINTLEELEKAGGNK